MPRSGSNSGDDPFGGGFGFQGFLADVYLKMRRCPQPIVALVHGAACGGGFAAASPIHINLFGPHPIVVHGTPEQQARWIPPLVAGTDQACFGFTEPDAGLDTTAITTLGMNLMSRCTSRMCSRPARAVSTVSAVSPSAY
jgi:alkylation response protein AidB-like acyl-CoA dehydrogenase